MKKILSLLLFSAVLLCSVISFAACSKNDPEGNATIVIATEEKQVYDIPLVELSEGKGLIPAFEYLKEKNGVEYDVSNGMINNIGGLENDYNSGSYIYIYTSVEKDFDVSMHKKEIEYDGKTLVSSIVGYEDMTLTDGAVIYIGLISWS